MQATTTFKNTVWLGVSYGIRMGSQAAVFVLLARTLGVQSFGVLAAAIAAANIIAPIVEYGSNNLSISDVVTGIPIPQTMGVSIALSILILPLNLLLLSLIKVFLLAQVSWSIVFFVGLVIFVGNKMISLANTIHIARGELWRNAVVEGFNAISLIVLVILFMYFQLDGEIWVIIWLLQSCLVGGLAIIWLTRRFGKITWSLNHIKNRFRKGIYFAINGTATSLYGDLDKTLLSRLASAEAVGVFTSSHRLIALANVPLAAFIGAIYPRFFVIDSQNIVAARAFVWKILPVTVIYGIGATFFVWFSAPLLAQLLGDGYADTTSAIRWLSVGVLLQCIYLPFMEGLTGIGMQARRMNGQLIALALIAFFNLWLIPVMNWQGAALSSLVTQIFLTIYMVCSLYCFLPRRVEK